LVKNYESVIPYGWRLAAVSDVLDSWGAVKEEAKDAIMGWTYGIACLEHNARFFGEGYSYKIEEDISCGDSYDHLGHKLIVRGGASGSFESCLVEENTDYPGLDLNLDTGPTSDVQTSALACRELCNKNKRCKNFGWKEHNGECWMKTGVSKKVWQRGTTSGTACRKEHESKEPEAAITDEKIQSKHSYRATLSNLGQLIIHSNFLLENYTDTYDYQQFCLETTWEGFDDEQHTLYNTPGEAVTLACDSCVEKAICSLSMEYYRHYALKNLPGGN